MKEITLTNYESLEEFIEVVESVHYWESVDADDYKDGVSQENIT